MLTVIAIWKAKPGQEKFILEGLPALKAATRAEIGNVRYDYYQDPIDPTGFLLYEIYKDQAALDAHRASVHFKEQALGKLVPLLAAREVQVFA